MFIEDFDIVAHNASFDRRFLEAELGQIRRYYSGGFACFVLASRRVYPNAPSHKLGILVEYKSLPHNGTFHRALADAEMTTHLWLRMLGDITDRHGMENIPFSIMQKLSRVSKAAATEFLHRWQEIGSDNISN